VQKSSGLQINIQENKDSNSETEVLYSGMISRLQINIQENKDSNEANIGYRAVELSCRSTSKRTRIQTGYSGEDRTSRARLQVNIQENKDSNKLIARQPEHRGVADPPPTEQGFLYPHLYDGG
jgi:hypothetical protein